MSWENLRLGPVAVHSSAGAPSGLPTARLASRSDTSSIGPLGGTPTCQYPRRPGQSCTVVSAPGSSTSIRGSGSVSPSSVEVECRADRKSGSASAARSSPRLVTTPSTRVSPSAAPSLFTACSRSSPTAMTFPSIGS